MTCKVLSTSLYEETMIVMDACELWDDSKAYEEIRETREGGGAEASDWCLLERDKDKVPYGR